ncbi:hypothetical protein LUZ61_014171 [Rhynchospora tenuis]|uniref:Disease resistance protein RGA3 n=1 Tax=Rhynchospora tenuis TaxID=198213 RepID=A0AAD5WAK8_9POAL|nr:hypothetical protein LUZ61_014171 [Rhynchospora tenuis]
MAMILDAFLKNLSSLVSTMVADEVGMLLGIPGEIEKLGETVRDIQSVLSDAERKQTKGSAIERWLLQLKDVMYDADDLMDLCQIKAEDRRTRYDNPSCSKFSSGFNLLSCFRNPVFAHKVGKKIKELNSRLDKIAKQTSDLSLQRVVGQSNVQCGHSDISRETDSTIVQDDIVGDKIEEDTKLLVEWLTTEENSVKENVRVELLKCIIREAGGSHGAAEERSELVPMLERLVRGKKFFLVLDDVWPKSQNVWNELLRAAMISGARGSRLLVTTRDVNVALYMKATKSHQVEKLSDEDGWSLLTKQVGIDQTESTILNDIGVELVTKCDGLPLAIKTIGGILRRKDKSTHEWGKVLRSNLWSTNDMLSDFNRAFHLSYEDLPPHLKPCFIFCSLYPEDYEFSDTELVYLWLAEGFLSAEGSLSFLELGREYYNELILRNLLKVVPLSYNPSMCKMHDLLRSFAGY